jgi:hypothetical protein
MADRMAEQRISYGGWNGQMVGMVKWREWRTEMVEWQTEMATYVLFTVHTDTDDNDDTLIFYSIDNVYFQYTTSLCQHTFHMR